jgi:hypothetical protein
MGRRFDHLQQGFTVGRDMHVPFAAEAASRYAASVGQHRPESFAGVLANIPQARRMAADYQAAPHFDPAAVPHYKAMREEVDRQFDFMTRSQKHGGMGMEVEITAHDPYTKANGAPDPAAMIHDVVVNRRIRALSTKTTGGHPFFTDEQNDKFRAIHDVFGHAAAGRGFDAHGEEAAFRSHYSMFTPAARPAMAAETRGQNSVNNYGGLAKGEFAEQKVVALPSTQLITPIGRRAAFHVAAGQARRAHERAFGIEEHHAPR